MELLSRSTKRLVVEMSIGIILYDLLLGVLAWVFLPIISYPVIPALWGLLAGAVGAILMFIHMAVTTERALESQNQSYASKTTIVQGMIRKVVLVAALLFCWRAFRVDLLAVVTGIMGMKAGAYLQPLIHKTLSKEDEPQIHGGGEDSGTEAP